VASVGNRPSEDKDGKPSRKEKTAAQNMQKEEGDFLRKESGADERRIHTPFDRLAELFTRMLEAREAFGKIQEDR
jgi:hypothetical protein